MVESSAAIQVVRDWASRLRSGVATCRESETSDEWCFECIPSENGAARIYVAVGKRDGTYDFQVAANQLFADRAWNASEAVGLLDAVYAGRVREKLIQRGGVTYRRTTEILVDSQVWRYSTYEFWKHLVTLLQWTTPEQVEHTYASYESLASPTN